MKNFGKRDSTKSMARYIRSTFPRDQSTFSMLWTNPWILGHVNSIFVIYRHRIDKISNWCIFTYFYDENWLWLIWFVLVYRVSVFPNKIPDDAKLQKSIKTVANFLGHFGSDVSGPDHLATEGDWMSPNPCARPSAVRPPVVFSASKTTAGKEDLII